ncbi:hypothetical protein [Streptomyces alboniger]|uniref:Secreted protein n=1 Tax=Streptomyces alboniger TaxID=132473 RepID=A0A5J6HR37_STRAD|nr:hypothetical protein [Streptomyces alboniger]QEV20801.1 hypothetical protein CP975_27555 [Streptomyces alboniger]
MRRTAAVVLGAVTLLGILTVPASAVPDPIATLGCVTQAAGDVTGLVDPAAPSVPAEIPGVGCLAP